LEGQKLRGFSAGEKVYGYSTHPVGELKINKKGQPKYDGMVHKINPEEADIIKRIYKEFVSCKSLFKIAQGLNEDKIPTKRGYSGGWNRSSISRILKNEKYAGLWIWKKYKNVKDPMTGRIKKVLRPEKEWLSSFRQELVIIDKEQWENAQKRWEERKGAWPVRKKSWGIKQKSYVYSSPPHLLSGLIKCQSCGGAIVVLSGKGGGYYGCYNARRKTCDNMLLVSRKRIEHAIISELKEKILTCENLDYVYKNVEKLVASGMNELPELIKNKKAQYDKVSLELQNYLNYIKMGNLSKAVSGALKETETKIEALKDGIGALEFQKQKRFKAPPKEWISHRLENLHQTLSKNTCASSLALKDILGTIQLEPISEDKDDFYRIIKDCGIGRSQSSLGTPSDIVSSVASSGPSAPSRKDGASGEFKPYYVAHTKIQTLSLLDSREKGSNWVHWWRRRDTNPFISKWCGLSLHS
ncbi:MAG: recombinase family protein, partial [Candidatus Omnitrophota bacterium]